MWISHLKGQVFLGWLRVRPSIASMIKLFKLRFLVVVNSQDWMTLSTFRLTLHSFNRHHWRSAGSHILGRCSEWCKLHSSFIVKLPVADIWALHDIIFIIDAHYPILLVSNLLLAKIGTIFTLISWHLILSVVFASIVFLNIGVRLGPNTIHASTILVIDSSVLGVSTILAEAICFALLRYMLISIGRSMDISSFLPIISLTKLNFLVL